MNKKVLVPIADGSEELEAVAIIDILRRAGADVAVASVDQLQITASRGVKLVADRLISQCVNETYDLIALPGGMPGAEHLRDCDELIGMLKQQEQDGRLYAAICASPAVVFQPHGLLEQKRATCHPGRVNALENREAAGSREDLEKISGARVRALAWYAGMALGANPHADAAVRDAGYELLFTNHAVQRVR